MKAPEWQKDLIGRTDTYVPLRSVRALDGYVGLIYLLKRIGYWKDVAAAYVSSVGDVKLTFEI